jgi:hypothetical protein
MRWKAENLRLMRWQASLEATAGSPPSDAK